MPTARLSAFFAAVFVAAAASAARADDTLATYAFADAAPTLEATHDWLAAGDEPAIILGDLNTPRREHPDGSAWSFARTSDGALRPERGERWEAAELGVMVQRLRTYGYVDAFRAVHGYGRKEVSWAWAHGGGWRLDHCLVRGARRVRLCEYVHEVRRAGLSDHSALVADVVL